MTDKARTPFRITRRGSDKYGWIYLAFAEIIEPLYYYQSREQLIAVANTRDEIDLIVNLYRIAIFHRLVKKGIKNE